MIDELADLIRRTRQHHAIEHATIHVLSARHSGQRFSAVSDPLGFTILADVDELSMRRAVSDAMLRLQAGEHELAIHPNCGTNLATTTVVVTLAALIGTAGRRGWVEKLGSTLLLVLPALIWSKPLGFRLQSHTTLPTVTDRWLTDVYPFTVSDYQFFRVDIE